MFIQLLSYLAIGILTIVSCQSSINQETYLKEIEHRMTIYKQADVRKNLGECNNHVIAQFSQATRSVHIQRNTIQPTILSGGNPGDTNAVASVTFNVNLVENVPISTRACKKVHFIINWGCKCGQCTSSEQITGTIGVTIVFDVTDQKNVIVGIPRDPPSMFWKSLVLSPFTCQGSVFGRHFHTDYTDQLKTALEQAVKDLDAHFIANHVPTADPIFSTPA